MTNRYIEVEVKLPEELMMLLERAHHFYPIGLPFFNEMYNGYKSLKKILENKINNIIAGNTPNNCQNFLDKIGMEFNKFEILNKLHRQFSNYSLTVKLKDETLNGIQSICYLNVKMSLLSNYFTVSYEDVSVYKDHLIARHTPLSFRIISSVNVKADPGGIYFNKMIDMTKACFLDYRYVHHKILFSYPLEGGTPYGLDKEASIKYPLYFYLFDNDLAYENYKVI